jgi:hypothetical protein
VDCLGPVSQGIVGKSCGTNASLHLFPLHAQPINRDNNEKEHVAFCHIRIHGGGSRRASLSLCTCGDVMTSCSPRMFVANSVISRINFSVNKCNYEFQPKNLHSVC